MKTWQEFKNVSLQEILDWAATKPWACAMAQCQQDAAWHAEGDVWTHTQMVCSELEKLAEWPSVGIEDRIKKANYGIIGGIGFTYNVGNARIGLEVNYHYGLQNLDNGELKYVDNQLISGTYDVPDDYSLDNLELSLQVIIPLKFITSKDYVPL